MKYRAIYSYAYVVNHHVDYLKMRYIRVVILYRGRAQSRGGRTRSRVKEGRTRSRGRGRTSVLSPLPLPIPALPLAFSLDADGHGDGTIVDSLSSHSWWNFTRPRWPEAAIKRQGAVKRHDVIKRQGAIKTHNMQKRVSPLMQSSFVFDICTIHKLYILCINSGMMF